MEEDEVIEFMRQDLFSRPTKEWDEIDWDTYYFLLSLESHT